MASWQDLVQFVVDGSLVNAANTNQAPAALDSNIRYLRDVVEGSLAGQALFARNRTVAAAVNVGQAVFYNGLTQQLEAARAAVFSDPRTGVLLPSPSSYVWGLVARKINATKADILLHGVAEIDLANAVSDTVLPGLYYLSGNQPGALLRQQPPVSVPVCLVADPGCVAGTYNVFVNPSLRDLLEGHKHYRFELTCARAANSTSAGWLPASDFGDLAPVGACYGYNLAASPLADLWPPIPTETCYLEWDKGGEAGGLGVGVPLGDDGLAIIDDNGIWWMNELDVPWYRDVSVSFSIDHSSQMMRMRLTLWFTKPTFANDQSCVLSLRPRPNSGLLTYCEGTSKPANTGNLDIDLDLGLLQGPVNLSGAIVMKQLAGKTISSGPVVESVTAGTSNVIISDGTAQGVIANAFTGNLVISVQDTLNGFEMPVETVRLAGAYEAFPFNVLGLAFDAGATSTIYGRIGVRAWPEFTAGAMKLRFWVLGRAAGSIPADVFKVAYLIVPMPGDDRAPESLPTSYSALSMNCAATFTMADQYALLETGTFSVNPGDTVMFSLTRGSSDDTYDGELDVLRKCGVLVL